MEPEFSFALCFAYGSASQLTSASLLEPSAESIDAIFNAEIGADTPGCAVGVFHDQEILHQSSFGLASLELQVPITGDTVFDVASLSKQFTATAIVLLQDRGDLEIDDDIRLYVPELHDFGTPITLRHLLQHTSGLRDYLALASVAGLKRGAGLTEEASLQLLWSLRELEFAPGTRFKYTNSGYLLLKLVIERVTGRPLGNFLADNVFVPLGMEATEVVEGPATLVLNRALGHVYQNDIRSLLAFRPSAPLRGSGGVLSSLNDLFRWHRALIGGMPGHATRLDARLARENAQSDGDSVPYGFGVRVDKYRGLARIHHGGGNGGFMAYVHLFPEYRFAVAALCNWSKLRPFFLTLQVAELFLENEMLAKPEGAPWVPMERNVVALGLETLSRYVGQYQLSDAVFFDIDLDGDQLTVQLTDQVRLPIDPISETEFVYRVLEAKLSFLTSDGKVTSLVLLQGGTRYTARRMD